MHKKIITGALLVFFVTSMFSSQSAFAGSATCTLINPGAACDDSNACTSSDICVLGACVGVPNVNSCTDTDNNECTSGVCAATFCVPTPNFNSCTDTDNNECTSGVCAATFCVPTPNFNSCDDGLECTFGDTCAATVCVGIPESLGSNCGDAGTQCTNQDTCNLLGQCIDSGQQPNGSSCGSSSNTECSNADTCFSGQCNPNNESGGITCGDAGTACTNQDTCDGSGGCSDNGFASDTTSCDADGNQCTGPDACDGSGVCLVGQDIDDIPGCFPVGGQIIPIEATSLLVSGVQTNLTWIVLAGMIAVGASTILIRRK